MRGECRLDRTLTGGLGRASRSVAKLESAGGARSWLAYATPRPPARGEERHERQLSRRDVCRDLRCVPEARHARDHVHRVPELPRPLHRRPRRGRPGLAGNPAHSPDLRRARVSQTARNERLPGWRESGRHLPDPREREQERGFDGVGGGPPAAGRRVRAPGARRPRRGRGRRAGGSAAPPVRRGGDATLGRRLARAGLPPSRDRPPARAPTPRAARRASAAGRARDRRRRGGGPWSSRPNGSALASRRSTSRTAAP